MLPASPRRLLRQAALLVAIGLGGFAAALVHAKLLFNMLPCFAWIRARGHRPALWVRHWRVDMIFVGVVMHDRSILGICGTYLVQMQLLFAATALAFFAFSFFLFLRHRCSLFIGEAFHRPVPICPRLLPISTRIGPLRVRRSPVASRFRVAPAIDAQASKRSTADIAERPKAGPNRGQPLGILTYAELLHVDRCHRCGQRSA